MTATVLPVTASKLAQRGLDEKESTVRGGSDSRVAERRSQIDLTSKVWRSIVATATSPTCLHSKIFRALIAAAPEAGDCRSGQ